MADLRFLPDIPVDLVTAAYAAAPGDEIGSGKFSNPESSSFLVANVFGYFLGRPASLPALPGSNDAGWPASSLELERLVRFPWSGGHHPCLDVLLSTDQALIGVESKRYEPFRDHHLADLSDAYWRPVWGSNMGGYEALRDEIKNGKSAFQHLNAAQLVKHAFGLRTAVQPGKAFAGKSPILMYLYAEPRSWPDGRAISNEDRTRHRSEIAKFSKQVEGCEVRFLSCTYGDVLSSWNHSGNENLRRHALAVSANFEI